jgi:hypothetical protein
MRFLSLFFLLALLSCHHKKDCDSFSTVEDLQKADLQKCKVDSMFILMQQFSGAYNAARKEKGIPVLPMNYIAEVYTVGNQVRWHSEANDERYFATGKPYMKWKDLEWNNDTLKYDRSVFTEGKHEHPSNNLIITYSLDTLTDHKSYVFRYEYSPKSDTAADIVLTKAQADSILSKWGLVQ